jgi:hypothetical protein
MERKKMTRYKRKCDRCKKYSDKTKGEITTRIKETQTPRKDTFNISIDQRFKRVWICEECKIKREHNNGILYEDKGE